MKATLFALFVALLMFGCGDAENKPDLSNTAPEKDPLESAVEWTKLQDRNGDAYIPNTDKPYSGWAKKTFENGQVEILAEFTDGTVTRLQQWQESGIPKWDIGYMKGKVGVKDVPIDTYADSNVSLHSGTSITWYENGQKEVELNFKDGKIDGEFQSWYKNGQMLHKVNFTNGKKDGTENGWYGNGQKMVTLDINNGKFLDAQAWLPSGENCKQTNLKNGNGKLCLYYDNNTLKQEQNFISGDSTKLVWFYSTGEKSFIRNFQNGLANGTETHFHKNGKVKKKGINKNGKKEGLWTEWYEDGTKESELNYQNGKMHGLWTQWREDGTKWWVSTYKLGKKIGKNKYF